MTTDLLLLKSTTARRKNPACGTCRKKGRKCDRTRPICNRCRTKGLHCEGYPPRFQFCDVVPAPAPATAPASNAGTSTASLIVDQQPGTTSITTPVAQATSPAAFADTPRSTLSSSTALAASASLVGSLAGCPAKQPNPLSPAQLLLDSGSSVPSLSPQFDTSTLFSETYARLDEEDRLGYEPLLLHFDCYLSETLAISTEGATNAFKEHVLPLAYEHDGVLHALLGLSACHMHLSGKDDSQRCLRTALRHRVAAIHTLGGLLSKEGISQLTNEEEEAVLAIVLLLVFHDICESGVSSHGAHLTGVLFLCSRVSGTKSYSTRSKASMFFVSALTWLDMLRGFSGAEKLMYSEDVREYVRDHGSRSLHSLVGYPPVIFFRIGQVLQRGKHYLAGEIGIDDFKMSLDDTEVFLRRWDPDQATYPTSQPEWRQLANAFRHACLLRVLRFPDAFSLPCTDPRIQESVSAILDICAQMPRDSVFYKRLLFPLFLAAVDTASPHQIHYASWCINEIKHSTGFQHPAMTELLTQVWEERQANSKGWMNVPWMEFTCSTLLESQHAYLFF